MAKLIAGDGVRFEGGDGVETGFDFVDCDFGSRDPGAEEAGAHGGGGVVEGGDERGVGLGGVEGIERLEELEIARGDVVEEQGVLLLVVVDGVDVGEGSEGLVDFCGGGGGDGVQRAWAGCAGRSSRARSDSEGSLSRGIEEGRN